MNSCISIRPHIRAKEVAKHVTDLYGIQLSGNTEPKELCSYDDRNFYVKGKLPGALVEEEFVVKVMNSLMSYNPEYMEAIDEAMIHFSQQNKDITCSQPVKSLTGQLRHKIELPINDPVATLSSFSFQFDINNLESIKALATSDSILRMEETTDGAVIFVMTYYVRLLTFVPGKTIEDVKEASDELLWECGVLAAKVQNTFKNLCYEKLKTRKNIWDLKYFLDLEHPYLDSISDKDEYNLVQAVMDEFKSLQNVISFPQQVLHADITPANIIVDRSKDYDVKIVDSVWNGYLSSDDIFNNDRQATKFTSDMRVTGIIDFGNLIFSCRVFQIAVCMIRLAFLRPKDPIGAASIVYNAFKGHAEISADELQAIPTCMKARLVQCHIIGSYKHILEPDNPYLIHNFKTGWDMLKQLQQMSHKEVMEKLCMLGCNVDNTLFFR